MKGSRAYYEEIIKSQMLTSETTVSFDVVTLFTCVPTDLAIQ